MNVLYRAQATSTGGRTGISHTDDGRLSLTLDTVKELGGAGGSGTNPEQLFAAGYSACFLGALKYVAAQRKVKIDETTSVTAQVGIGQRDDGKGFGLEIVLSVSIPGVDQDTAQALVDEADIVCPYSHLAHNGAQVAISVA